MASVGDNRAQRSSRTPIGRAGADAQHQCQVGVFVFRFFLPTLGRKKAKSRSLSPNNAFWSPSRAFFFDLQACALSLPDLAGLFVSAGKLRSPPSRCSSSESSKTIAGIAVELDGRFGNATSRTSGEITGHRGTWIFGGLLGKRPADPLAVSRSLVAPQAACLICLVRSTKSPSMVLCVAFLHWVMNSRRPDPDLPKN